MFFVERYLRLLNLQSHRKLSAFCNRCIEELLDCPSIYLETYPSVLGASIITTVMYLCYCKKVAEHLNLEKIRKDLLKIDDAS